MDSIRVYLLDKDGESQYGLNWGQRVGREPNQAYLQLESVVYNSDFFPTKGTYFLVNTDDGETFIMNRAQKTDTGTAIQTPENNSIIGLYMRKRLGVAEGTEITKADILKYGRIEISFKKIDDRHYRLDYSKDWKSCDIPHIFKTYLLAVKRELPYNVVENYVKKSESGNIAGFQSLYNEFKDSEFFNMHYSKNSETMKQIDSTLLYCSYTTAIRTKPFLLLAGISGTGKSRIVRELAFMTCPKELQDKDGTTPGNYCMIEVKPNWHDSTELLGYDSAMEGRYKFSKFDKFVVKAWLHPDVPFFVCLDEMNLAPVEQYFAEFLSVLETRSRDKDHNVVTGAIIDKIYFKDNTAMLKELGLDSNLYTSNTLVERENQVRLDLVNKGLTLPPNLIIVGTVNMDDTTYQFSRKVIDRAMTIEMNGGDLGSMFGNSGALSYRKDEEIVELSLFKAPYINADEMLECYQAQADTIKKELTARLTAINEAMKDTPFQVSYRVLNELVVYLGALLDEADGDINQLLPDMMNKAVDQITLMKILPRIEGDEDMFRRSEGKNVLKILQELFAEETDSYKKLEEMKDRLNRTGFTRFWP